MTELDSPETTLALRAFQVAWEDATRDYAKRLVNSEHCLQAILYRGLRKRLSKEFSIYVEAVVHTAAEEPEVARKRVIVDLLVCHGLAGERTVLMVIELKFTPKRIPKASSIRKDLTRLSRVTNRRNKIDRATIEMPRYRKKDEPTLSLLIPPQRKVVFGVFCTDAKADALFDGFWRTHRPIEGAWKKRRLPKQLVVAVAKTTEDGRATSELRGKPLDRLQLA